jgi:hypothetical protein
MKKKYLLILFTLLISINALFATTTNRSILLEVDIAETGPLFSLYKGESSNGSITGVSPSSENVTRTLDTDALLVDNLPSSSILKYYFFVGSNFTDDKALDINISSEGFTNSNTTTTVPIITEVTAPTHNSFTKTISTHILNSSATEVISDYVVESSYYLDKYTTSSNYTIPNPDTYNASRANPGANIFKELFFMELSIGWNGQAKLPAGDYSATIQIAYSVN